MYNSIFDLELSFTCMLVNSSRTPRSTRSSKMKIGTAGRDIIHIAHLLKSAIYGHGEKGKRCKSELQSKLKLLIPPNSLRVCLIFCLCNTRTRTQYTKFTTTGSFVLWPKDVPLSDHMHLGNSKFPSISLYFGTKWPTDSHRIDTGYWIGHC